MNKIKKYKYIDALRGVAILLVIMVHCSQRFDLPPLINQLMQIGPKGVQLFFIISAFTLFLSINKRREKEKFYVFNFFLRRFFRIAPLYYLGIIYFGLTNDLFQGNYFPEVITNILFVHGISPYLIFSIVPGGWSITVEMMFYLLVPFLSKKIKTANQALNFLLISYVFSLIFRVILLKINSVVDVELMNRFLYSNLINQLPVFALGFLSYFIIIKKDFCLNIYSLFISLSILIAHLIWGGFLTNTIIYSITWFFLIYILSVKEFKILVNTFFISLGKISYSAYLIHFAVLGLVDKLIIYSDYNFVFIFTAVIVSTFMLSRISYIIIEIPFMKLGKKFLKG